MKKEKHVIVIGAGPAGLSAALYLLRSGIKVTVIERLPAGGQAGVLTRIANYPGIIETDGYSLISAMTEQVRRLGCAFVGGEAFSLDPESRTVLLSGGERLNADRVVVATGVSAKRLGLPRERELTGAGVSYCATCDGNFFRGKAVAVAGRGPQAKGAASFLARIASAVYFVSDGDAPGGVIPIVGEVVQLIGTPLSEIEVKCPDGVKRLAVSGLFVACGYEPNSGLTKGLAARDEEGYITVDGRGATSERWIYAAGDVTAKELRQIVTAAADGATVGWAIAKAINEERE